MRGELKRLAEGRLEVGEERTEILSISCDGNVHLSDVDRAYYTQPTGRLVVYDFKEGSVKRTWRAL
jgi:hypothetical protein